MSSSPRSGSARPAPWWAAAAAAAALLIVTGCTVDAGGTESAAEEAAAEDEPDPVPVEVVDLERGRIEAVLRSSANLEAENEVGVHARTTGLVEELLVEEGDRVRQGAVLLRLEDDELRSAVDKATSQVDAARREYERQQKLFARDLITEQAFNDATYELEQLAIALDDARRELSYAEVRAPIGGTITQRLVNVGDRVIVGTHLFDLVDFASLVARIYVPEKELPRLRPGQPARLRARAAGPEAVRGRIERIAPIVDARTGTVKVTVGLEGQHDLLPGMYVEVGLVTAVRDDALLVPKRALVYDEDQSFVYRLGDGGRVERIRVESRLADEQFVEPAAGLAAGDRVVVAGQAGLKDGAVVRVLGAARPDGDDAGADGTALASAQRGNP